MYYNLNNKKQRRQFWKDCEKALSKCDVAHCDDCSWDVGRKLTPLEVFEFWDDQDILWSHCDLQNDLSKNALDTINHYEINGVEDLDGYDYY